MMTRIGLFSESEKLYFNCMSNNSKSNYISTLFRMSDPNIRVIKTDKEISFSKIIDHDSHNNIINQKCLILNITKLPYGNYFERKRVFPLSIDSYNSNRKLLDCSI